MESDRIELHHDVYFIKSDGTVWAESNAFHTEPWPLIPETIDKEIEDLTRVIKFLMDIKNKLLSRPGREL